MSLISTFKLPYKSFIDWTKFILFPFLVLGFTAVINHKFFGEGIFTIDREMVAFWIAIVLGIVTVIYVISSTNKK